MMFCQMGFGFSFYGVMIVLTPFFLEKLQYSEADTLMVIGAFGAVGTLFSIAGGVIGDKFLGRTAPWWWAMSPLPWVMCCL
nr:hypothetical protein [Psychrobacter sp. PraFG1]UNK05227.1 hypothetical protein MN210_14970 [Psychrobacter sp. PraFG1]